MTAPFRSHKRVLALIFFSHAKSVTPFRLLQITIYLHCLSTLLRCFFLLLRKFIVNEFFFVPPCAVFINQILFNIFTINRAFRAVVISVVARLAQSDDVLLHAKSALRPADIMRIWHCRRASANDTAFAVTLPHLLFRRLRDVAGFAPFRLHLLSPTYRRSNKCRTLCRYNLYIGMSAPRVEFGLFLCSYCAPSFYNSSHPVRWVICDESRLCVFAFVRCLLLLKRLIRFAHVVICATAFLRAVLAREVVCDCHCLSPLSCRTIPSIASAKLYALRMSSKYAVTVFLLNVLKITLYIIRSFWAVALVVYAVIICPIFPKSQRILYEFFIFLYFCFFQGF